MLQKVCTISHNDRQSRQLERIEYAETQFDGKYQDRGPNCREIRDLPSQSAGEPWTELMIAARILEHQFVSARRKFRVQDKWKRGRTDMTTTMTIPDMKVVLVRI
jgi:hypothetical protein